jgi:hypothetical protein
MRGSHGIGEGVHRAMTIGAVLLLTGAICDCGDPDDNPSGSSEGAATGRHADASTASPASGSGSRVGDDSEMNAAGGHAGGRAGAADQAADGGSHASDAGIIHVAADAAAASDPHDAGGAGDAAESGVPADATVPPPVLMSEPDAEVSVDQAPSAPTLLSPRDGASELPADTALCWNPSTDPEGDALRYRVFVDGNSLKGGIVAEEGFAGPCTEPLHFDPERTFQWAVEAYEVANPSVSSPRSRTWSFSTAREGGDRVVLDDGLEQQPTLWTTSGDASSGQWVLGTPEGVLDGTAQSQPAECADGNNCFFTGHNLIGAPSDEDVDGGSAVLLSPAFDLSGAGSVTVSLSRFFYRGDSEDSGTRLQLELLAPDPTAPDGYRASVLEAIDRAQAAGANAWTAVAFSACDLPFGPGFRLRIIVTDPGDNIVEAAIDRVLVTAHEGTEDCEHGVGALCDTKSNACDPGLLCCAVGTLNRGMYRCAEPAAAIEPAAPGSAGGPFSGELGCPLPDLTVLAEPDTASIETVDFPENACALHEQCIGGPGPRRLLRFGMLTRNVGAADLVLGVPANHPDEYHYDECHGHYHFEGYADYALKDGSGNTVVRGGKIAQCVWDSNNWAWPRTGGGKFACYNQGLTVGFEDEYAANLDCQWLDITGVAPGNYTVAISINIPQIGFAAPRLVERDYDNNVATFPVTIPPP